MTKTKMLIALLLVATSAHAATAYLTGEQETGMTRQCFYDYLGSTYTITISATKFCPFTIEVSR